MTSFITNLFLRIKLQVTLEEAERLHSTVLDLRTHGLEECPSLISQLSSEFLGNLRCLLLQKNKLAEFSRVACHVLRHLKALTLDYNQLTDIPYDFRNMRHLTILNVSHNSFSGMHFFHAICQVKTLKVLWANATGMTEIPKEIQFLKNLRTLGLRRNRIRKLPLELFTLTQLKWLTLSENFIREIPSGIINLSFLSHLNLERNRITSLPFNLNMLEDLQYLMLQYNRLTVDRDLVQFIGSIPRLKGCWLAGNLSDPLDPNGTPIEEINQRANRSTAMSPWSLSSESLRTENGEVQRTASMNQWVSVDAPQERSTEERGPEESGTESDMHTFYRSPAHNQFPDKSVPPTDGCLTVSDENESVRVPNVIRAVSGERQFPPSKEPLSAQVDAQAQQQLLGSTSTISQAVAGNCIIDTTTEPVSSNFGNEEHPNIRGTRGNCEGNGSYRMSRTHDWVTSQTQTPLQTTEIGDNGIAIVSESGTRLQSACAQLIHQIEENVDNIMENAAEESRQVNIFMTQRLQLPPRPFNKMSEFRIPSVRASIRYRRTASCVAIIPLTSEPLNVRLETDDQAGETFEILENEEDNSMVSALDENDLRERSNIIGMGDDMRPQIPTIDVVTSSDRFPTSFASLMDLESNYDHSDWEHSISSSAIDDQDIITRFEDIRDDGTENALRNLVDINLSRLVSISQI